MTKPFQTICVYFVVARVALELDSPAFVCDQRNRVFARVTFAADELLEHGGIHNPHYVAANVKMSKEASVPYAHFQQVRPGLGGVYRKHRPLQKELEYRLTLWSTDQQPLVQLLHDLVAP